MAASWVTSWAASSVADAADPKPDGAIVHLDGGAVALSAHSRRGDPAHSGRYPVGMHSPAVERDTGRLVGQEQWLRSNGLPLVVPARRRLRGVVPRTVPLLVAFAFLATALLIADAATSGREAIDLFDLLNHRGVVVSLVIAGIVALAAIPMGMFYAAQQRKLTPRWRLIIGLAVIAFWLFGLSGIAGLTNLAGGIHLAWWLRVALLLIALLIGFYGLGSMLSWAARRGAREISVTLPAIARILPLLLLTVLLVFFTNELWQLAAAMTQSRMVLLSLFLIVLIVLIALPTAFDMVDDEDDTDCEDMMRATPFAGITERRSRLSLGERVNLLSVSLAVQFVQVAIFVVITFAVFAIFGSLSVTEQLIRTWTNATPHDLEWLGIRLPMDAYMFRVCMILALFSGITFAASTMQDEKYRDLFLDRIAAEVRRNLVARHRYRATLVEEGRAPSRWELLVDDND